MSSDPLKTASAACAEEILRYLSGPCEKGRTFGDIANVLAMHGSSKQWTLDKVLKRLHEAGRIRYERHQRWRVEQ